MKPIIAIVGPTGVGKTSLSLEVASFIQGEVISCDAMQFYKGMDIGTAKIKKTDTLGITHHLIDILDPKESFSVKDYQDLVRNKIASLKEKNISIILAGGSGLYLQSVLYDYQFSRLARTTSDNHSYSLLNNSELMDLLTKKYPEIALTIPTNNRRRILRALEITENDYNQEISTGKNLYYKDVIIIGLSLEKEVLYKIIDERVETMFSDGLIEEVKKLYDMKISSQSVMAIGYKELYQYFDGLISLEETKSLIKLHSRRYAKRQMTWFRNKMDVTWFYVDIDHFSNTKKEVIAFIKKSVDG